MCFLYALVCIACVIYMRLLVLHVLAICVSSLYSIWVSLYCMCILYALVCIACAIYMR